MNPTNTAFSMAEGNPEFKMDVSLVFGGEEPSIVAPNIKTELELI